MDLNASLVLSFSPIPIMPCKIFYSYKQHLSKFLATSIINWEIVCNFFCSTVNGHLFWAWLFIKVWRYLSMGYMNYFLCEWKQRRAQPKNAWDKGFRVQKGGSRCQRTTVSWSERIFRLWVCKKIAELRAPPFESIDVITRTVGFSLYCWFPNQHWFPNFNSV